MPVYSKLMNFILILTGLYSTLNLKLRPGLRVLMYHRITKMPKYDQLSVDPELFEIQMSFLKDNFDVISIVEAIDRLKEGTYVGNEVVITFDDGYIDNYLAALPVLKKYNLPASIFITTEFTDQVRSHPRYETEQSLHLSWDDVNELTKSNITIGAHTVSHPYLQQISPQDSLREIQMSKLTIENNINLPVDIFCYPSGDYGQRELTYLKQTGYIAALTVSPGVNRQSTNLLELKRTEITNKDDLKYFKRKMSGAFDPLHFLLDLKRKRIFSKKKYNKI